ncbi:hypothetical protein FQN49_001864 [Arthroderma sp. PD_2]|nr:hypothetical protein FQN49_001864 [Arthroderma sp. PD_2]
MPDTSDAQRRDDSPNILDAFLPSQAGPASPITISPAAPAFIQEILAPVDYSPKPAINRSQFSKPDTASHDDASRLLKSNTNIAKPGTTRVALEQSPGAENLPVRRTKRQKLGDQCDRIVGNMGDSVDQLPGLSPPAQAESTASKPKARKPRKQSQKNQKSDGMANSRLKGRVTKASGITAPVSSDKPLQDFERCSHDRPGDSLEWETDGLPIEDATKRRNYWTPTKDVNVPSIDLTGSPCSPQVHETKVKGQDFSVLMSEFNFAGELTREKEAKSQLGPEGPTTKHLLEFMPQNCGTFKKQETENPEAGTSSTSEGKTKRKPARKAKRPAKSKITTITSLTTGRYESPVIPEAPDVSLHADPNMESIQTPRKPPPKRRTTKAKSKEATQEKAKYQAQFKPAPTLEALKAIENQTLLFGTSSQLERDSSPSVYGLDHELRVQSLDQTGSNQSRSISRESSIGLGVSRFSRSKNMWGASSRDLDGSLMGVEVIDLVDPAAPKITHKPVNSERSVCISEQAEDTNKNPPSNEHGHAEKAEAQAGPIDGIKASDTTQKLPRILDVPKNPKEATPADNPMPEYSQLSTAELAKKLTSFGFKPLNKREKMIELLEKCWKSKHKTVEETAAEPADPHIPQVPTLLATSNTTPESLASVPTKKSNRVSSKRTAKSKSLKATTKEIADSVQASRPAPGNSKSSSKTTEISGPADSQRDIRPDTIEIEDSTDESPPGSPKQPRNQTSASSSGSRPISSRQKSSPLLQTVPIRTKPSDGKDAKEPADLPSIFLQITNAVKAQPRMRSTNGVKQPTWHEKIVMYDPIWLDDLTVWLNVEGFKRIGEDREVYPSLVREWCESKGICCCYKNKR